MPIMIDMPIAATEVPELDAILVTHSDNDHYSVPTCRALAPVTRVPVDGLRGLPDAGRAVAGSRPRDRGRTRHRPGARRANPRPTTRGRTNPPARVTACSSPRTRAGSGSKRRPPPDVEVRRSTLAPHVPPSSHHQPLPDIDSTADLSARRHRPCATVEHWDPLVMRRSGRHDAVTEPSQLAASRPL